MKKNEIVRDMTEYMRL